MSPHAALPPGAVVSPEGTLILGGCSVTDLAARFGTPLYVYDRATLRDRMTQVCAALGSSGSVHYAAKAYLARWLLRIVQDQGLGLDVSSSTELRIALEAGFPADRIRLHGNNKQREALHVAIQHRIGAVVVDSLPELQQLLVEAKSGSRSVRILLRLNPGIEAHTHRYLQTGLLDSKFGIPTTGNDLVDAVRLALDFPEHLELLGYHAHIGTQILDVAPYRLLLRTMVMMAEQIERVTGFWPTHLSPGGGPGICYTDEVPLPLVEWVLALRSELEGISADRRPHLSVEPGRALVGPAGVALYTVGITKRRPGGRTYICVDGGMADNIRPALYGAKYAALPATAMFDPADQTVAVAGPFCESGDLLIEETTLPQLQPGSLLVLPAAGAYCLPMSSNYNGALRPAVVVVEAGFAQLVQRRQTLDDLRAVDVDQLEYV